MTTYLIVPEIDDLMDDALKIINREMKKVFDQIEDKVANWYMLNKKTLEKQTRRSPAGGRRYDELLDELHLLYGTLVPKEQLMEVYDEYLARAYDAGAKSTEAEIDLPYSFSDPDIDFLHEMSSQGRVTFAQYFGSTGARLRNTIIQVLGSGKGWQTAKKEIQNVYGYSRDRADKIIRTELARATTEARLNQYDKTDRVVYVEWFAQRDDAHCSGCAIAPTCAQAHGMQVKKEDAHGMQPAHVRCRCAWVPVTVVQAERKILDDNVREFGVDEAKDREVITNAKDAILALPDGMRKHIINDISTGQLQMCFTGHNEFEVAYGDGYESSIAAFYQNTRVQGNSAYRGLGGYDVFGEEDGPFGNGTDFVVMKLSRITNLTLGQSTIHELSHHTDLSVIPRLKGYWPSGRFAGTTDPVWKAAYKRQKDMFPWKRWVRKYGVENQKEFQAVTFEMLFKDPLSHRKMIKERDLKAWNVIRKWFKFLDKSDIEGF